MISTRLSLLLLSPIMMLPACIGQDLLGRVAGTQTQLQRAIRDGSKAINCAPKETAIAEANIRFAQDALSAGDYSRGKEYWETAEFNTERALRMTDPTRCQDFRSPIGDRDGDGYDDEADRCPDEPEDFDSFEDHDGCVERDNDGDQVEDASTLRDGEWINLDQKDGVDCRNEPEDIDTFEDADGCPDRDNDLDQIFDDVDACRDDPEDVDNIDDSDGCPEPDNDSDKLCDPWVVSSSQAEKYAEVCTGSDHCPDRAEDIDGDRDDDGCPDLKAEFDGCSVRITEKVFFKFNKWDIDPRSYELLGDVATVMRDVPAEVHFRVEGHTDSQGDDRYNLTLSQRRADSVRNYLVSRGVLAGRLIGQGFGEERPIDTNRSSVGRARNRRVEFNVTNVDCRR